MTGLGAQLGNFRHGIGTKHPFRFLTFKGKTPEELLKSLKNEDLPGLDFRILSVKNSAGGTERGVYIIISDWNSWHPTALAFAMMELTARWQSPNPFLSAKKSESTLFNKHVGSSDWWNYLVNAGNRVDGNKFMNKWEIDVQNFRKDIQSYLLYD